MRIRAQAVDRIKKILRRTFRYLLYGLGIYVVAIVIAVWVSGDDAFDGQLHDYVVNDITQINPVPVSGIVAPRSLLEIVDAIRNTEGPISIGGGRFSMGGQTAIDHGVQIDMRDYDAVVSLDAEGKLVTVQSGITWRELQEHIDPADLSVKIMQTYANFTVGGSLSVNVHGRYIGHGPLISSVIEIELVLADGSVVRASRDQNSQLFHAAIGGYGGIGVISEVTLDLADNRKVERRTTTMPIEEYRQHFADNVRDDREVVFHNADIYPPAFDKVRDVSWYLTDAELTIDERLIAAGDDYFWLPKLVSFSNSGSFGKWTRRNVIDPVFYSFDRVARRNWEASYDVRELGEGDRSDKTWVLQEYFIPVDNFDSFVPKMRQVFQQHDVDVVNVSIRHALPDTGSYLAWAREEVFAFVVYHSQGTTDADKREVGAWTREMIDKILEEGGSYYLPYQPHATAAQFNAAYPKAGDYFAVKKAFDPGYRFRNRLWDRYYPGNKPQIREYLHKLPRYKKGEEQTFLTLPEWYLVFNPDEYADFLDQSLNPSDFPFFASIDEYWTMYDRVTALTEGLYPDNADYQTTLWVIGVSTTAEFLAKGAYENTFGRFTRWTASEETPEDRVIREAHRAYAELIHTEPWYVFPFADHVGRIWGDTPFFGGNFIRKFERKLMFTLEFGFKAMYAKAIGFGAQAAFEASDGLVRMYIVADEKKLHSIDSRIDILRNFGDGDLVVALPRWGGFTEIVPKLAAAGVEFVEISGNDEILFTTTEDAGNNSRPAGARFLFNSMVISPEGRKRSVYVVRIEHLTAALNSLDTAGIKLEHVFDF